MSELRKTLKSVINYFTLTPSGIVEKLNKAIAGMKSVSMIFAAFGHLTILTNGFLSVAAVPMAFP